MVRARRCAKCPKNYDRILRLHVGKKPMPRGMFSDAPRSVGRFSTEYRSTLHVVSPLPSWQIWPKTVRILSVDCCLLVLPLHRPKTQTIVTHWLPAAIQNKPFFLFLWPEVPPSRKNAVRTRPDAKRFDRFILSERSLWQQSAFFVIINVNSTKMETYSLYSVKQTQRHKDTKH